MSVRTELGIAPEIAEKLKANWSWLLILSIVMMIGGISAIALPMLASLTVPLIFGIAVLFGGIAHAIHAFSADGWNARIWQILTALLYILGGFLLLAEPLAGLVALSLIVICLVGAEGVARLVMAFSIRPQAGWGWLAFGGLIAIAFAIYLLSLWPAVSAVLLGTLIGISLIFEGVGYAMLALAIRRL